MIRARLNATDRFLRGTIVAGLLAGPPCAAAPELIDLGDSVPYSFDDIYRGRSVSTTLGDVSYFFNDDGIHGRELWRSDGTEKGTNLVLDLCPGVCGSWSGASLRQLAVAGQRIVFAANDGVHGVELWATDGTASGTHLLRDFEAGFRSSSLDSFVTVGERAFFWMGSPGADAEIWVSDGTQAGTDFVAPSPLESYPACIAALNDLLIFGEYFSGGLWRSDGTFSGTYKLADVTVEQQNWALNSAFVRVGDRIVFWGDGDPLKQLGRLWATDGSIEGTSKIADVEPYRVAVDGDVAYFLGENETLGRGLWTTNGTAEGTSFLWSASQGAVSSSPGTLAAWNGRVIFVGWDEEHGAEPWIWDGSSAHLLLDIYPGFESSVGLELVELFFGSMPPLFSRVGDRVLFFARNGTNGLEPWVTDGDAARTHLVRDVLPGSESYLLDYFQGILEPGRVADALLVRLRSIDGSRSLLHLEDSTDETTIVSPLDDQLSAFEANSGVGAIFAGDSIGACFQPIGSNLLFNPQRLELGREPHVLDLAGLEAAPIADFTPGPLGANGRVCRAIQGVAVFGAQLNSSDFGSTYVTRGAPGDFETLIEGAGMPSSELSWAPWESGLAVDIAGQLWTTDGTIGKTEQLGGLEDCYPIEFETLGPSLLTGCLNLNLSDGQPGPLTPLIDWSQPSAPYPDRMVRFGARVLFSAGTQSEGQELWTTNGTPEGTHTVRDIWPGSNSGLGEESFTIQREQQLGPTALELLVVFAANDGLHGEELWRSDGTFEGTVMVSDIINGPYPSSPRWLTRFGSHVYFVAESHGKGRELWRTDGTEHGTELVADLVKGNGSSLPENLHAAGSELYFSAWTPARGREAWRIRLGDSKNPQPVPLDDIAPGALSSSPQIFREIGGTVFTVANDNVHGFELWTLREDDVVFSDGFEGTTTDLWAPSAP